MLNPENKEGFENLLMMEMKDGLKSSLTSDSKQILRYMNNIF